MIQIGIVINKEIKTFTQHFIPARMFRRTIEMQQLLKKGLSDQNTSALAELDTIVNYAVELFDRQFTADEFYNGISAQKVLPTLYACINAVVSGANEAIGVGETDPNV